MLKYIIQSNKSVSKLKHLKYQLVKYSSSSTNSLPISEPINKTNSIITHHEKRNLRYSCQEIYDIVYNVNDYKNFMPWCIDSKTLSSKNYNIQELTIGFKSGLFNLSEKYTSKVEYVKDQSITAISLDNKMFNHLNSKWLFTPGTNANTCTVNFYIEFSFKSEFHSHVANIFFEEVAKKIVSSFESRCRKLYGIR